MQEYKDGIPEKPREPGSQKKIFRLFMLALLIISLGLLTTQFGKSELASLVVGKGLLTGKVTDGHGQALVAQVYIFGVDRPMKTAPVGSFTYQNAPAGNRNLIVTYNGTAQKYNVLVQAGKTSDLGIVPFSVTTPTAS